MALRVLVVDDSRFYRNRLVQMIETDSELSVVDVAENGADAVAKTLALKPDVVTMDIEMPVMNGIDAVKEIMRLRPTPILMFSSLTTEGAKATLDALEAGALDFIAKKFDDVTRDSSAVAADLCKRLKGICSNKRGGGLQRSPHAQANSKVIAPAKDVQDGQLHKYKIVLIGASTGGPAALQSLLSALPEGYKKPIIIIQHMPATFTGPFAARLDSLSKLKVSEAKDGDVLMAGHVYIAPGGKQLEFERSGTHGRLKIRAGTSDEKYHPSVDTTFRSAAKLYEKDVLAIVLTGMGSDGKQGAGLLKAQGSSIWAQDEASCVVYGMPQAVVEGGHADKILSLDEIVSTLVHGS